LTKALAKRALKNGSAATWKDEKDGKTKRMDKTKADRMHGEYLTLPDMRKARHLSQVQLAETTGAHQATVVKCERQSDHLPSTLTSYVRAMGAVRWGARSS
jgi:DNA-binding XRE family transcriptional regulator